MNPADIRPVHDYGDPGHISSARAARMTTDDADAFKGDQPTVGYPRWKREWTQHEADHAIADRHVLMHELARALTIIEQLTPRVITLWTEADCLPEGTTVVEANGEVSTITHRDGEHYWQSTGDTHLYHSTMLSYPIKVVPLPTGAWVEADEAEEAAKELDGP